MSDYFDIEAIGRWVLGRHWRRATTAERREFLALFEDWIALGYASRFGEYAGQTVRSDFGSTVRQGGGKVSFLISALRDKVKALKSKTAAE